MKYYQSSGRKKGGIGLYVLIAFAFIAVGIIAWFSVSRMFADTSPEKPSPSVMPSDDMEYDKPSSSYNDTTTPDNTTSDVVNSVESVPYDSSESDTEEPKAEDEPKQAPIMPIEGSVLKDYSDTALQYSATYDDMRLHTGVDIEAEAGTTVLAAADGTVTATDESASLGKTVTIDHGDGIIIKYCGLENVVVSTGKTIKMGDPIAVVGSIPAECADKSHLHIEATKNGEIISPMEIIGVIPE